MKRRLLFLPLAAVALALGAEALLDRAGTTVQAAPAIPQPGYGTLDHAGAVLRSDQFLAMAREKVAIMPDQWLPRELYARALLSEQALTGSYATLVAAGEQMATARALAPAGSGPILSEAHYALAVHKLDDAEAALARFARRAVPGTRDERAEVAAFAGDIAFYRGDIDLAERQYRQAEGLARTPGVTFRLANIARARGEFDTAARLYVASLGGEGRATPRQAADVAIQLGALDQARGRYESARAHFIHADTLFPGHWLYQAHRAQADYLTGRVAPAMARMEELVSDSEHPEAMEFYALMLLDQGREEESRTWADRAGAIWEDRLALLPEASYGHAIEHQFVFGAPERALELAEFNLAERPYGEARLLMAEALLANERPAEALEQIRLAREAGWLSAPHLRAEVNALEALGRDGEAQAVREEAIAINPHVFDPVSEKVWFSHG